MSPSRVHNGKDMANRYIGVVLGKPIGMHPVEGLPVAIANCVV